MHLLKLSLLTWGLFLTLPSEGVQIKSSVKQHPPSLILQESDTILLKCELNTTRVMLQKVTFKWIWRNQSLFHMQHEHAQAGHYLDDPRISVQGSKDMKLSCLKISPSWKWDSGVYSCMVSILWPPPIEQLEGEFSNVTVEARKTPVKREVSSIPQTSSCRQGTPLDQCILLLRFILLVPAFFCTILSVCLVSRHR